MPPKRKAASAKKATSATSAAAAKRPKRVCNEKEDEGDMELCAVGTPLGSLEFSPLLCFVPNELKGCNKFAGFDMDHTLIAPKSGKKFPKGRNDWVWLYPCIKDKLKELHKDGFQVLICTNQMSIEKGHSTVAEITGKIRDIIKDVGIPILGYISTGNNQYRKPSTLMWDYAEKEHNNGVKVDRSKSIFCGDAAGRNKDWASGKPKDFTVADRMFAANLGVPFKTPEELFLGEQPTTKFEWRSIDPSKIAIPPKSSTTAFHKPSQEMILMVGPPASGKSSFSKRFLINHGYVHINRDTLNTPAKCLKVAIEALDSGKSVVIDNTNPSKAARQDYINEAIARKIPCRCFVMTTPLEIAHHLNFVRVGMSDGEVRRIPDVAYNIYKKNFEKPEKSEGLAEILDVEFSPYFEDENHKKLFLQWTSA